MNAANSMLGLDVILWIVGLELNQGIRRQRRRQAEPEMLQLSAPPLTFTSRWRCVFLVSIGLQ